MDNLDKVYLRKEFNDMDSYKDVNNVYIYISERDNYYLLKKLDTLTKEEDVVAISKDVINDEFYTALEFLEDATFIGKSGYFNGMHYYETALYKTFIIIYASSRHMLIYDTISDTLFVAPSSHDISKFIPFAEQYNDVSFNEVSFTKKRVK